MCRKDEEEEDGGKENVNVLFIPMFVTVMLLL
jgi:hypothetical protein